MAANPELLTTREAALVAGVEVRDINRLIDEHILPDELVQNDSTRLLWAGACALVRFYYGTEKSLTADERKGAIRHVCLDARRKRLTWTIKALAADSPAMDLSPRSFPYVEFRSLRRRYYQRA
jgi:hypothetical protein